MLCCCHVCIAAAGIKIQNFFHAIIDKELIEQEIPPKGSNLPGKFIDFAEPMVVFEDTAESKLYVRSFYKTTYEKMKEGTSKSEHGRLSYITITGSPGIGKSHFGIYCLIQRLKEGHDVVYCYESNLSANYLWFNQSSKTVFEMESMPTNAKHSDIWQLVDGDFSPGKSSTNPTIHFVSYGHQSNSFEKNALHRTLYFAPFSLQEMQALNTINENIQWSEKELIERYNFMGGIPRSIFRNRDEYSSGSLYVEAVCKTFVGRKSDGKILFDGGPLGNLDGPKVVLIYPKNEKDPFDSDYFTTNFASPMIRKKMMVLCASLHNPDALIEFALHNNGPVAGCIFEFYVHSIIKENKLKGFKFRRLQSSNSNEHVDNNWGLDALRIQQFDGYGINFKIVPDTYYYPSIHTFPAIDSFYFNSKENILYLFQVTITGSRKVKIHLVEDLLRQFESNIPSEKSSFDCKFVIVCREDNFTDYPPVNWSSDEVFPQIALKDLVKNQFVLCIPSQPIKDVKINLI